MERRRNALAIFSTLACVLFLSAQFAFAAPLTLQQAEKVALAQSPEIKALQAKSQALKQSAIASGQLADPKLIIGTMNVPVDSFNFSQTPMTQIAVGLQQNFPRGRSLHYRSQAKQSLALAELQKKYVTKLKILQSVRLSWLQLYYLFQAKKIIYSQKKVFRHLTKVTESMLANNKAQQKDVIRAQLELTDLDNRIIEINQHIDIARAELGRWIGPLIANKASPQYPPRWGSLLNLNSLNNEIKQHPTLQSDQKVIFANQSKIKVAKQQYKPGFSLGVAYGFREGRDLDGRSRSDFLTAEVSMDLPFFTHNRQDRTLKASEEMLIASQDNQMSHYRELREELTSQYATWKQQEKSVRIFQLYLIPQAKQYAEATMIAYQNAQTDFPTLARAYVRELNTELSGLKAVINRDAARVNLLYLEGK